MPYHLCSKCNTYIQINHDPEYTHYVQNCLKILCIWCVHQNFITQYNVFTERFPKNNHPQKFKQFGAYMPCCGKFNQGALSDMKQFLQQNCCINGFSCPQKEKGSAFMHEYDYHLKIGKQCYRQLLKKNQQIKNKGYQNILEKLNNLSIKKCQSCNQNDINIVIGQQNQTNFLLCLDCYLKKLPQQQINQINQISKQNDQSNSNHFITQRQKPKLLKQKQKQQIQRQQCDRQSKYSSKQILQTQQKQQQNIDTYCSQCSKQFQITAIIRYEYHSYCYFCLFMKFQDSYQHYTQGKMTKIQYIQILIVFQLIFSNHCLICGLDYSKTSHHNYYVFTLQSKDNQLQASYCATCQLILSKDTSILNNLIHLKGLLVSRKLWQNRINTRMTIASYKMTIKPRIKKLQEFKQRLILSSKQKIPHNKQIIASQSSNQIISQSQLSLNKQIITFPSKQVDKIIPQLLQRKEQYKQIKRQQKDSSHILIDDTAQRDDIKSIKSKDSNQCEFISLIQNQVENRVVNQLSSSSLVRNNAQSQDEQQQQQKKQFNTNKQDNHYNGNEHQLQEFDSIDQSFQNLQTSKQIHQTLTLNNYISNNPITNQQAFNPIRDKQILNQSNQQTLNQVTNRITNRQELSSQSILISSSQSILISSSCQQQSNTNQFSPQLSQLQQAIKLQLKNQIIHYSLQQQPQQHINNKQLSLSIFNNQIKPFLLNNQSLKTSIQHIQQLNSLLLNTPYFNPNLQLNQPNQINQQVNQINHFKNQQISSNKPSIKSFFSAKQSHCLNCHQLDFLLAFDQLCHQCFLNYLMGSNLHAF